MYNQPRNQHLIKLKEIEKLKKFEDFLKKVVKINESWVENSNYNTKQTITSNNNFLKKFIERYLTIIERQKELKEENEQSEIEKSNTCNFQKGFQLRRKNRKIKKLMRSLKKRVIYIRSLIRLISMSKRSNRLIILQRIKLILFSVIRLILQKRKWTMSRYSCLLITCMARLSIKRNRTSLMIPVKS